MEFNQLRKIIVKSLLGEASEKECHLLEQWRTESEANRQLFDKLMSESFLKKAISDRNKELRIREWKKLEIKTIDRKGRLIPLRWVRLVAAVCILGVGVGSLWLWKNSGKQQEIYPLAEQIHAGTSKAIVELAGGKQFYFTKDTTLRLDTQGIQLISNKDTLNIINTTTVDTRREEYHVIRIPNGGEYIARLEDGSVVHLNAGSELKVPVCFGKNSREVWLKGEGYFEVVHQEKLVFTVHTDKSDISVLGTEFDVRAYADEKEVLTTLVQGAVEVATGKTLDHLQPGEQARVTEEGNVTVVKVDVYPLIAWKNGRMVFENETLERIMAELQRWYDFEVFYDHPEVKEMRFTIDILKYDELSKILNLIEKMNKVRFTQKGRAVVLHSH